MLIQVRGVRVEEAWPGQADRRLEQQSSVLHTLCGHGIPGT